MIFDDRLLSKGEAGGKEAASLLWNQVAEYVHQNLDNVPSDYKIVTRIYANLKGLGDTCHKSGIIDKSETIEDFARGFTGGKQLFDFVDVGVGKDRADDKLSGGLLLLEILRAEADWSQKFSSCICMTVTADKFCLVAHMIMDMLDFSKTLQISQYLPVLRF